LLASLSDDEDEDDDDTEDEVWKLVGGDLAKINVYLQTLSVTQISEVAKYDVSIYTSYS
jgi:hypothetical protein